MLIRFNVTNFLSFKEETEFNMLAGSPRSKKEHVYHQKGIDFMRAAALYGANGAGKSNLVKALAFLQELVLVRGSKNTQYNKHFKLDEVCAKEPSIFEIEFIEQDILFAYTVSIIEDEIIEESLYKINEKQEDELLFKREKQEEKDTLITTAKKYQNIPKNKLLIELYAAKLLKKNELFLSKVYKDDIDFNELKIAFNWFHNVLAIMYPSTKINPTELEYFFGNDVFQFTQKAISSLDTGIISLKINELGLEEYLGEDDVKTQNIIKERLKKEPYVSLYSDDGKKYVAREVNGKVVISQLQTQHQTSTNKLVAFDINEESDGTQRLFDILPVISLVMTKNKVCIIDEINRSVHPTLTKELIKLFMDTKETKGQLIFSTHEAQLLDLNIFRQDEIWFAEKNKGGATTLYPLSDFDVRSDLVLKKGYLSGRFGAIPFLGNLKELNWEEASDNG
jgi:AAA15 family ATPase/GTPase